MRSAPQISRDIEANNKAIETVQKEIEVVQGEYEDSKAEIKATQKEIDNAATRISECEAAIAKLGVPETLTGIQATQYTRFEAEKKQLREKERQLREEKRQLREKESKLLDKQNELRAQVTRLLDANSNQQHDHDLRQHHPTAAADAPKLPSWHDTFDDEHIWPQLTTVQRVDTGSSMEGIEVYTIDAGSAYLAYEGGGAHARRDTLVVRPCAQRTANEVMAALKKADGKSVKDTARFLVSGNPGIGKSVWTNYLLWRCYRKGVTVIQHDLSEHQLWLLQPGKMAVLVSERVRRVRQYLRRSGVAQSKVLYLCDTGGTSITEPDGCPYTTVLTSSPDRRHFKQFVKQYSVSTHVWPVWSRDEVRLCHDWLFKGISRDRIQAHYDVAGGILRHLGLDDDKVAVLPDEQRRAASALDFFKLQRLLSDEPTDVDEQRESHKLVEIVPVGSAPKVRLLSEYAAGAIRHAMRQAHMDQLQTQWRQYQAARSHGISAGVAFEAVLFKAGETQKRLRVLCYEEDEIPVTYDWDLSSTHAAATKAAGPRGARRNDHVSPVKQSIESAQLSRTRKVAACAAVPVRTGIAEMCEAPANTVAVDGWLLEGARRDRKMLWLLQATVKQDGHSVNVGGLLHAIHCRRLEPGYKDAVVRLAFVVPEYVSSAYCGKQQRLALPGRKNHRWLLLRRSSFKWQDTKPKAKGDSRVLTREAALAEAAAVSQCTWVWNGPL